MKLEICEFIQSSLLPPNSTVKLETNDDLMAVGMLDSMKFMRLVQFIEEQSGHKIPAEDLVLENFQSVDQILAYLATRNNKCG